MNSWVPVPSGSDFPIQNLPYGVCTRQGADKPSIVVAIGDSALDLRVIAEAGLFAGLCDGGACFKETTLNTFMGMGKVAWSAARARISSLLAEGGDSALQGNADLCASALISRSSIEMMLPATIGDYTDFYSSRYHATNVGIMFRGPENALMPNWLYLPVGYHGRASSVMVSGTDIRRPRGQLGGADGPPPTYGPCRLMDFELEMAFFVGKGNALGDPITMDQADDHIFGACLMNDWSARDIQKWEYVPLGPFNAKNVGTTISPWIVTMEALEEFRVAGEVQEPVPLDYLREDDHAVYDINLEVSIQGEDMPAPHVVSRSNARHLYWSFKQQLVHHTSTGCNMRPGDLLGSGTISGPEPGSYGSMLEISWKGTKPVTMPDGSQRRFLADGDTVAMSGYCQGNGYRIGFGECTSSVMPAHK